MIRSTSPSRAPAQQHLAGAAAAGMLGPAVFVTVFTIEGWRRPGYQPRSMFVSELARGPRGAVQIANFLVAGACIALFGRGLRGALGAGPAALAGPRLVQVIGLSLMASGPFVTDPSAMFKQHTVPGMIHGVFGAIVFATAPVTCVVFSQCFRADPAWRPWVPWTRATASLLGVGIALLKVSQFPQSRLFGWKGAIQRMTLISFMAWLFAVAARVRRLGA